MRRIKAVVLERSGSEYTVLDKNGTFRQIQRALNAEVGEEIEIESYRGLESSHGLRQWAAFAALFLLILTSLIGWNLRFAPTAVAMLSVDINPSIQVTLDAQGRLLKIQTQNEDAQHMLDKIDLKGKPIDEVLGQIIIQAYNQNYLNSKNDWVVVGYSPLTEKASLQMPKELNENQVISWITKTAQEKGFTPKVAVFYLTSQEQELAQKGNLTLGEYALWTTAQKAGLLTQPQTLKDNVERTRLLENPQVQAQIKVQKQGLESGSDHTTNELKPSPGSLDKPTNNEGQGAPSSPTKAPNSGNVKGKEQGQGEMMTKPSVNEEGQGSKQSQEQSKELDSEKTSADKEALQEKRTALDTAIIHTQSPFPYPIVRPGTAGQGAFPSKELPEQREDMNLNENTGSD